MPGRPRTTDRHRSAPAFPPGSRADARHPTNASPATRRNSRSRTPTVQTPHRSAQLPNTQAATHFRANRDTGTKRGQCAAAHGTSNPAATPEDHRQGGSCGPPQAGTPPYRTSGDESAPTSPAPTVRWPRRLTAPPTPRWPCVLSAWPVSASPHRTTAQSDRRGADDRPGAPRRYQAKPAWVVVGVVGCPVRVKVAMFG